jgi:putative hemolysin
MPGSSLLASFSQLLPPGLPRPVVAGAHRLLGLDRLAAVYDTLQQELQQQPGTLPGSLLRHLGVRCNVAPSDLQQIPRRGAVIFISNHPFGILEGAVLAELLPGVRADTKFLANSQLNVFEEIRDLLLPVDPFEGQSATRANLLGVKRSIEHLRGGGALVIFPAGEVSHFQWTAGVADPEWRQSVARIARLSAATVVPVYVAGKNSALFQAAGMVHARLRTVLLVRELLNKHGATVEVRVGSPIPAARLEEMSSDAERVKYLRWRTYLLAARQPSTTFFPSVPAVPLVPSPPACFPQPLASQIAALPAERLMLDSPEFAVYMAPAAEIPGILAEIGRLREITFRAVGEGTGKSSDIDEFDAHYLHLFLWDKQGQAIAGAYRLAPCDAALERRGVAGLYTATLFRFGDAFLNRLKTSAVELGRSFIRVEYQKSFSPLLMMWKGIGRFIARNPRYTTLFGPVSISNRYREISRHLMVSFLQRRAMDHDMARWISTRHGYRPRLSLRERALTKTASGSGAGLMTGVEDLSDVIADLESRCGERHASGAPSPESRGVPVLLRQYLSLGGKLLGFNVDPHFSNALDGLILVNLTQTQPRLLERFLGKEEARKFLVLNK